MKESQLSTVQHARLRKAGKLLGFLGVCLLVGFLPVFVDFDCSENWVDIHFPGEYQRIYRLDNFYECVRPPDSVFHPPLYQPVLVNTFLLIVYSSIVCGLGRAVVRRVRRQSPKQPKDRA